MKQGQRTEGETEHGAKTSSALSKDSKVGGLNQRIVAGMSDAERYSILKTKTLVAPHYNGTKISILSANDMQTLRGRDTKLIHKTMVRIGEEFSVYKTYRNEDVSVEFDFSRNNLRESMHKQDKAEYANYPKLLSVLGDAVESAVGIETHKERYQNTDSNVENVYVLSNAIETEEGFLPVLFEVKEINDGNRNTLHIAVSFSEIERSRIIAQTPDVNAEPSTLPASGTNISLQKLLSNVNASDKRFLRYIPDGFLNAEQLQAKKEAVEENEKYIENKNNKYADSHQDGKHSTVLNSNGDVLSGNQAEYFKDSKVRDKDGNLLVMYQGSTADFTVFDRKKSRGSNLYGRGFYFTADENQAKTYGEAKPYYLNIEHPLSPGQHSVTRAQMRKFLEAVFENDDEYSPENYGENATVESVLKSIYGKGDFEMIQDVNATAIGDMVAAVELFNEVNGTEYDGLILDTETVIFNSEQAKNIDNLNPTGNPDVRFSAVLDSGAIQGNNVDTKGGDGNGETDPYRILRRGISGHGGTIEANSEGTGEWYKVSHFDRIIKRGSRASLSARDNEGRRINDSDLSKLRGTVVVDGNGHPLAVYHFSGELFETFMIGDIGFHSGSLLQAHERSKSKKHDRALYYRVYVNIKSPLFYSHDYWNWNGIQLVQELKDRGIITADEEKTIVDMDKVDRRKHGKDSNHYIWDSNVTLRKILIGKGYDGIIYKNTKESSGASFAVFSDEQIVKTAVYELIDNKVEVIRDYAKENDVKTSTVFSRDSDLVAANQQLRKDLSELRSKLKTRTAQKEYWKGQTKTTDGRRARLDDAKKLARTLAKEHGSKIDVDVVGAKLKDLADFCLNEREFDDAFYEEARMRTYEIAHMILDDSEILRDEMETDFSESIFFKNLGNS